jgi:hypothetical protein
MDRTNEQTALLGRNVEQTPENGSAERGYQADVSASSSTLNSDSDSTSNCPPGVSSNSVTNDANARWVLIVASLITWAFEINQATQLFVFYQMECDIYWDKHGPWDGTGNRCQRSEIAAGTAYQFSRLCMSTYFLGIFNLFLVDRMSRKWGPRRAMAIQIFFPMLRLTMQLFGVAIGRRTGERIIQASQMFVLIGGPAGYKLTMNTTAGEVVPRSRRTAMFGQLQGVIMAVQGVSRFAGGVIGSLLGVSVPYILAIFFMLLSQAFVQLRLPYISPESLYGQAKASGGSGGEGGFFAPLKILQPQTFSVAGRTIKYYGVTSVCLGLFTGVLATGFVMNLIQIYATETFYLGQDGIGLLMFEFCTMRGLFLLFAFPVIIDGGRRWFTSRGQAAATSGVPETAEGASAGLLADPEAVEPSEASGSIPSPQFYAFDLFFLRWSYLLDSIFMTATASILHPWQMHIAAWILPLASGSAAAARGTVTAMVPEARRAEALSVVNLSEQLAMMATQALFGIVYGWFTDAGHSSWTFYCNGAIALLALCVLLPARLPPAGSRVVVE